MVGVLVVVLGASGFVAVDGGYTGQSQLPIPHRTIEVFAPESAMQPLIVSDGDAPQTHFSMTIESGPAPQLDGGEVLYGDALVAIAEPLTLRIKRSGSLSLRINHPISRQEGDQYFVDRPAASFALIPSAPFEDLGGGQLRVVDAIASVDVQLQVSAPPISWPVLGGYQSWGANLVWDAARGRITRFGGGDAFELEPGTFVWDPMLGWQQLPIASPPPRVRASLVYDSARQRLVLFGGLGATGLLADTWEFDGAQWTEVTPPSSPPRRWSHGAAFDENTNTMLLFGGLEGSDSSNRELGDTWSWNGFIWTQLQPTTSPSSRDAFGMAWDGTRRRVMLAAGWDGLDNLNDAWAWVGGNWVPLPAIPALPRSSTALAWNPMSGDLLLAGGWDPRGGPLYFGDTWRFDGTSWRSAPPLPRPRARVALVGHPSMGVLMLGGRYGPRQFSAEFGTLEPSWQRLTQGERPDRGIVYAPFSIAGERYVWSRQSDDWVAIHRMNPGTQIVGAVRRFSEAVLFTVDDAGLRAFDTAVDTWLAPDPPPFQFLGELGGTLWLVDENGALRSHAPPDWAVVGTVPAGLRALTSRAGGLSEFLTWHGDGLHRWTPFDGGVSAFGQPLALDGGVVITSTYPTAVATGELGSWHLSATGRWIYVGQPRLPELTGSTIVTDAGLASWSYLKPIGARCESALECPTGHCVDGRCCDQACTQPCEACSVAAGGRLDGTCTPASRTTVCFENECGGQAFCNGQSLICTSRPPECPPDAGPEPEPEPAPDAGIRPRDAGRVIVEEPEPPAPTGCGCVGSPGAAWLLAAMFLMRARKHRRPTR